MSGCVRFGREKNAFWTQKDAFWTLGRSPISKKGAVLEDSEIWQALEKIGKISGFNWCTPIKISLKHRDVHDKPSLHQDCYLSDAMEKKERAMSSCINSRHMTSYQNNIVWLSYDSSGPLSTENPPKKVQHTSRLWKRRSTLSGGF